MDQWVDGVDGAVNGQMDGWMEVGWMEGKGWTDGPSVSQWATALG